MKDPMNSLPERPSGQEKVPMVLAHSMIFENLGDDTSPYVEANLQYCSDDPYAMHVSFADQNCAPFPVLWVAARDLAKDLIDGNDQLKDTAVIQDIKFSQRPAEFDFDEVLVELYSDDGVAYLVGSYDEFKFFVDGMYNLVKSGHESEHFDFDKAYNQFKVEEGI